MVRNAGPHGRFYYRYEVEVPMPKRGPSPDPSRVFAERGEVLVDGPDGVVISMTPDAAEETARRLNDAAARARSQDQLAGDNR
jgi:hypothetical protein